VAAERGVQVDFHSGVTDKLGHACRLLRKAVRQGARVQVRGEPAELEALDQALWAFEPQDFVPHLRWQSHEAPPPPLHRTPVWLVPRGAAWPEGLEPAAVLVHLGPGVLADVDLSPPALRVIEIVGPEPAEVEGGRQRWRNYLQRGHAPVHHNLAREAA
jgi:DNA polymerase-3 subunit chi